MSRCGCGSIWSSRRRSAAAIPTAHDGTCQAARIGVTGLGAKAFRASAVEAALANEPLDEQTVQATAEQVARDVEPLSDVYASGEYRTHLARVYTAWAIHQAASRALD